MLIDINDRMARFLLSRTERALTASSAETTLYCRSNVSAVLAHAGVEPEQELKMRNDGRAVLMVRHPRWGRCVLKTTYAVRSAAPGWTNLQIARFVPSGHSPIFPQVYEATADYTLEEYISGVGLRKWMEGDRFERGPLEDFLLAFRRWGESEGPWMSEAHLHPYEIKTIMDMYVGKCLRQVRYRRPAGRVAALSALLRSRGELVGTLNRLKSRAEEIEILRGRMCGDMANINLIVDLERERIFIIDYEFAGPGSTQFDCAYLLTSLAKLPISEGPLQELASILHSADYAGSKERAEFFADFSALLTRISRMVYGTRD